MLKMDSSIIQEIENIYNEMEKDYDRVAEALNFGCKGCPDNCCDSYFVHHTYLEWSYLWVGVKELPPDKQEQLIKKAKEYIIGCEEDERNNKRPQQMCPLNENGLCILYKHRLMVCRTHGVPAVIMRPDGRKISFPGCFRCQEIVEGREDYPVVERTPLLQRLAQLENRFLENRRHQLPKVRLTIAEMLVKGPPSLPF